MNGQVAAGLRARAKSDEQARARNLPRLLGRGALADERTGEVIGKRLEYSVASRTTGGQVYIVFVEMPRHAEMQLRCTCAGGEIGRDCWHCCHVLRALAGQIGQHVLPEVDEDDSFPIDDMPHYGLVLHPLVLTAMYEGAVLQLAVAMNMLLDSRNFRSLTGMSDEEAAAHLMTLLREASAIIVRAKKMPVPLGVAWGRAFQAVDEGRVEVVNPAAEGRDRRN